MSQLLSRLASFFRPRNDLDTWAQRVVEKIRTAMLGGQLQFLPWLDNLTEETQEVRDNYRKMLREPTLKAALLTKVLAVASLDVQVHPEDKLDAEAQRQAEFDRHALQRIKGGARKIIWSVFSGGLVDGFSVSEKVWTTEDRGKWLGKWVWGNLKAKDTRGLQLAADEFRNVVGVRGTSHNNSRIYEAQDFVIWSYLSFFENPGGMSDFRAPYRAYWIKDSTWQLRGLHLDKFTGPYLKGTYAGTEQKAALEAALEEAKASNWVTVPAGVLVDVIQLSTRGTTDFEAAIRDCDREMLIGTLGAYLQIMEGQVSNGRGDTKVHKETSELFQWMLAAEAGDILTEMVWELNVLNFADPKRNRVTLGGVSEQELEASARVDKALQEIGLKLSKKATYEKYGRQEPEDEADVLQAPQQGFPAGGPALPFSGSPAPAAQPQPQPAEPFSDPEPAKPPVRQAQRMAEPPPAGTAKDQVALPGKDGVNAQKLLDRAIGKGVEAMAEACRSAAERLVKQGAKALRTGRLFNHAELSRVAEQLAATTATGNLLGRARIRERQRKAEELQGARTFSDEPTTFASFASPLEPMPPEKALAFFTRLEPRINVTDPDRWGEAMERHAFTMAARVDRIVLERIQDLLRENLETGKEIKATPKAIDALLEQAGVSPRNPQYSEMVVRTNLKDAYNTGADQERMDPDVAEIFPVWRYAGIRDGRQGEDHEPHFDRYYPNDVSFDEVRGDRPFNCRCDQIPIDKWEWAKLQEGGARVETSW